MRTVRWVPTKWLGGKLAILPSDMSDFLSHAQVLVDYERLAT